MRGTLSLLGLAGLSCSVSCSLLFESQAADAGDATRIDAAPGDSDASPPACLASMPLNNGSNPAIVGAQAIDLDSDGVDEVLLFTDAQQSGPATLVSASECARDAEWVYQDVWQPTLRPAASSSEEPLRVGRVARAVDANNEVRLVAMAEGITTNWLAAFALDGKRPADDAAFFESLPQSSNSTTCSDAEPPFAIIAGSFDDEPSTGPGDLVFAQQKQSWRYLVNSWSSPEPWNSQCTNSTISGDIPEKLSGPGTRLGLAKLPALPGGQDGHLELRDSIFSICSNGNCSNQSWGAGDITGGAIADIEFDDDHIDFVAWRSANPVQLLAASLSKSNENITATLRSFAIVGPAPNDVVLLSNETNDFAVLLFDASIQLFALDSATPSLLRERALDFASNILATPNWGPDGASQLLLFRADTGEVQCLDFAKGDLQSC